MNHTDPRLHWTIRGRGRYFECIDNRARFEYNLRCPWRSDTVDRELFVSSTRQAFQRGVVRLSAMNRSWVSPFGDKSFSLGASPCKACSPSFMVHFIVFSSLFRVLFVLPVGLAWLDVFRFSFRRLECSRHPSHDQSTKGDFRICWAPALARSSIGFHVARKPPWKFQPAFFFSFCCAGSWRCWPPTLQEDLWLSMFWCLLLIAFPFSERKYRLITWPESRQHSTVCKQKSICFAFWWQLQTGFLSPWSTRRAAHLRLRLHVSGYPDVWAPDRPSVYTKTIEVYAIRSNTLRYPELFENDFKGGSSGCPGALWTRVDGASGYPDVTAHALCGFLRLESGFEASFFFFPQASKTFRSFLVL